jgi:hypothetical protein
MERVPTYLNQDLNLGQIETPDEIKTWSKHYNYYDGSYNLATMKVHCNFLSSKPNECVNNPNCGYCQQNNSCIPGSDKGPMTNCLKGFYFKGPVPLWNPLEAGTLNIMARGKDGKSAITLTGTPNMNTYNRDSLNPYN